MSEHKVFKTQQFTVTENIIIFKKVMSKRVKGGRKDRNFTPNTPPSLSSAIPICYISRVLKKGGKWCHILALTCYSSIRMVTDINDA